MRIIGGTLRRRTLHGPAPDNKELRPTHDRIRENVFNILSPYVQDAVFLDLFSGCGCMGMEALSRGASRVVFVDSSPNSVALIRKNVEAYGLQGQAKIVRMDVINYLSGGAGGERFDIVYVDPPYNTDLAGEALKALGDGRLLSPEAIVIAEHKRSPEFEKTGVLEKTDVRKYSRKTWISIWKPVEGSKD